jgi:hypothetical protein
MRSGDLLPPSPPAVKTAARQDQAGKACTSDGGGNAYGAKQPVHFAVDSIASEINAFDPLSGTLLGTILIDGRS